MESLDIAASSAALGFIEEVRREIRRECKEKSVWVKLLITATEKKILGKALAEAIEYGVGHHKLQTWTYEDKVKVEKAIKKGDFNGREITGELLFEVFDEVVEIVKLEKRAQPTKKDEEEKNTGGKDEKEKDTRGGLNDLIGSDSTKWALTFLQQFEEYSEGAITPIFEAIKAWAFANEDTKKVYLDVRALGGAQPPKT